MDELNSSISSLHRQAIDAALQCNWEQAILLNQQIIETEPSDIASLNRLARALCEIGKYSDAKKIYHDVLKIDPYNSIAQKNLKKVSHAKDGEKNTNGHGSFIHLSPTSFLQEPGITKIVTLIKVAEPQRLLTLSCGSTVLLVPKLRSVTVVDPDNHYLGVLPDDTAFLLLKLIRGGNKYEVIVKSVKSNAVTVLIREVFRSKKFRNQPSFLDEASIMTISSDTLSILSSDHLLEKADDGEETSEQ